MYFMLFAYAQFTGAGRVGAARGEAIGLNGRKVRICSICEQNVFFVDIPNAEGNKWFLSEQRSMKM